ncbi:MAG TPA: response regulator, partial [Acidimicrobiia bacterium]
WPAMAALLLIADDEWVRNDIAAAIVDPSTTLTVLDDPADIVGVAGDRRFDLYAVDMQIASTGGMATVRLLKDAVFRGEIERAPIVLLLDRSADVFLAKRAGADAHLIKPFTSQQLREVMSHLLPEASN